MKRSSPFSLKPDLMQLLYCWWLVENEGICIGFRAYGRQYGDIVYWDCIGITFPCCLISYSQLVVLVAWESAGLPEADSAQEEEEKAFAKGPRTQIMGVGPRYHSILRLKPH